MKRKSFRQNGFSGSENSRNLGFHRNVRRRDYLTDSVFFHGFNFYNYEFQIMNYELKFLFLDSLLFVLKTNFLYGISQFSDFLYIAFYDITVFHPFLRITTCPNSGWSSRSEDVSRFDSENSTQILNQIVDVEQQKLCV